MKQSGGWCIKCLERMAEPGSETCSKCKKKKGETNETSSQINSR